VIAEGGVDAAGIGNGNQTAEGLSFVNCVIISNSTIDIGGGHSHFGLGNTNLRELRLIEDISLFCSSEFPSCITTNSTMLINASIQARIENTLFLKEPERLGLNDLVILYSEYKSSFAEPTFDISNKMIQLGNLSFPPNVPQLWTLQFLNWPSRNVINVNLSSVSTILLSVPNVSYYRIPISSNLMFGLMCSDLNGASFLLSQDWSILRRDSLSCKLIRIALHPQMR
jgi:hypothetical protein